jgi:hypothetical protein
MNWELFSEKSTVKFICNECGYGGGAGPRGRRAGKIRSGALYEVL